MKEGTNMIEINGKKIKVWKKYSEYTKEELMLLPPLGSHSKDNYILSTSGKWLFVLDEAK